MATKVRCGLGPGGEPLDQELCCPFADVPDPDFCRWSYPDWNFAGFCSGAKACNTGEVTIASNDHCECSRQLTGEFQFGTALTLFPIDIDSSGSAEVCNWSGGPAYYCCESEVVGEQLCSWSPLCFEFGDDNQPKENPCGEDDTFTTYRKGGCEGGARDNYWNAFCCNDGVSDPKCRWDANEDDSCLSACGNNEIDMDTHYLGGGEQCNYWDPLGFFNDDYNGEEDRRLCCDKDALHIKIRTLPVPLENLWEKEKLGPDTDKQTWTLTVDDEQNFWEPDFSQDPDDHAFGWHIFSGPEDKVTTLDKRDGSDWQVFDCDDTMHEGTQSAKMICTRESEGSNCNVIWKGQVERTIIEMPRGCGPAK